LRKDTLRESLRRLPAEKASPGFTQGVLARLDTPSRQPASWRLIPLAAVVLLAAVALPAGWYSLNNNMQSSSVPPGSATAESFTRTNTSPSHLDERARVLQELAALQEEKKRLNEQWREYRRLARAAEPVLYLGGNDNVDLVFDLRRVPPTAPRGDVIPAAMTNRSPNP
jgi:hypothetical protein